MKVYGDILSGNCYKVKWVLHALSIPHSWQHLDIVSGETHTPSFKKLNPNAKVPLLVLDTGESLRESNAIIHYLAEGSTFLPNDRFRRAQVLQWQFFEQYSHEPYIAVARYIKKFLNLPQERLSEYEAKQSGGHRALSIMNKHLEQQEFFVGNSISMSQDRLLAARMKAT